MPCKKCQCEEMNISKVSGRESEWSITFDSLTSDKNLSQSLSEWKGTEWDNTKVTINKKNERREKTSPK